MTEDVIRVEPRGSEYDVYRTRSALRLGALDRRRDGVLRFYPRGQYEGLTAPELRAIAAALERLEGQG